MSVNTLTNQVGEAGRRAEGLAAAQEASAAINDNVRRRTATRRLQQSAGADRAGLVGAVRRHWATW